MRGEADSLNVGVATSIVIYQSMIGRWPWFKRWKEALEWYNNFALFFDL
jgi:hypothetical protein